MWRRLVIDYPRKSVENCYSQALDEQFCINLQINYVLS